MLIRVVFLIVAFFIADNSLSAQNKIRWMSWEEALKKHEKSPKKIFVDVIIDRCTWCKKMDASTFSEDQIAKYINENYYPVRFDAYSKNPITFKGQTYEFVNSFKGGYHELAAEILQGKLSYPTSVFIDENLEIIQSIPGYQPAYDFDLILRFFAENFYKNTPWRKFVRDNEKKNSTYPGVPAGKN